MRKKGLNMEVVVVIVVMKESNMEVIMVMKNGDDKR